MKKKYEERLIEWWWYESPIEDMDFDSVKKIVEEILSLQEQEQKKEIRESVESLGNGRFLPIGLKVSSDLQDINTYDIDRVVVHGNNRKEIMSEIIKLLTQNGFKMYGKLHKWRNLASH